MRSECGGSGTEDCPAFLITIDTEGDNLWSRPREVKTENAKFLPCFQELCESWGLKPTYLVDYDMARSAAFVEFGRNAARRETAEIGMHLHAWNTPPLVPLTEDDDANHPYLFEYPADLIREKVALMTNLLEETFEVPIRSHRSGRWAFNEVYAQTLVEQGYCVDCSVTPHISWRDQLGNPVGEGGADYRNFSGEAYFVDLQDVSRAGESGLLEVPMTIMPCEAAKINWCRQRSRHGSLVRRAIDRFYPPYTWLRPKRDNLEQMLAVIEWAQGRNQPYVEFMLHSSELMPGGSPSFPNASDIEKLYEDLNVLFEAASAANYQGATLSGYYHRFCVRQATRLG